MTSVFKIDGEEFEVGVISLSRDGNLLDGPNVMRFLDGDMTRDLIGTYINYSMNIGTSEMNPADYDRLYEIVTAPVDFHDATFPYGQQTVSQKMYVANVSDELVKQGESGNVWGNMQIKYTAKKPYRRP